MNYAEFMSAAVAEDARNRFSVSHSKYLAPVVMQGFYSCCNPIDVEIVYPGLGAVRFYPLEECSSLKDDYELLDGDFVFATCDDDPIFLRNDEVYTSLHDFYNPEKLASSFDEFLDAYVTSVGGI